MSCPINMPKFQPVPKAATFAERKKMYDEWCKELHRMNPSYFFADGRRRGVMSWVASLFCKSHA